MKHYVFQLCRITQNSCIIVFCIILFLHFWFSALLKWALNSPKAQISKLRKPLEEVSIPNFSKHFIWRITKFGKSWMSLLSWIHVNPYTISGIIPLHGISTYSTFSLFAMYVPESQKLTQESSRWQYDHAIHNLSRSKSDHKSILYRSQYLTNYW